MLSVAVIGLGWWGQVLVRAVQNNRKRIRVMRGVSPLSDEVSAFARSQDIRVGESYDEALTDPEIDAIVLATPHSQHADQIILAAEAGKHVFCEKPLALKVTEAKRALAACKRAGVVLAVGHNMRFLPAAQHMARLISDGALGKPLHIEGHYSGPSAYRRARGSWRLDPSESPLGGMTGMGIHISDLMISMFGEIDQVWTQSTRQVIEAELDDTTSLLFRFRSGLTGSITTLTATADLWRLTALGSDGWIEMRGLTNTMRRMVSGEEESIDFPDTDIERAELEAFADAVEYDTPYPVRSSELIANIALLEAAQHAVENLRPLALQGSTSLSEISPPPSEI